MIQINDEYYEDLTPESVKTLLTALKEKATSGKDVEVPGPGPLSSRESCENSNGITNLTEPPEWNAETMLRKDGALDNPQQQ